MVNNAAETGGGRQAVTESDGPLVSVVIPSYDRPEFVRRAVESVLDQTYAPIELVVVDDHSPEPVEPHLRDLSVESLERFQVIRHETNRGGNAARNTGIEATSGEFLTFLDDDDRWLAEKVEKQVDVFEQSGPEVGVVYNGAVTVDGDEEVIATFVREVRGDVTDELLRGTVIGSFSRVMVRRSVVEAAGLPDERFPNWQDHEWYVRLSQHCEFESLPELLTVFTNSEHRQITDDFEGKRDVAFPLFLEKHRQTAAEYGWATERRFVGYLLWCVGWTGFTSGHRWSAIGYLLRSIRTWPFSMTPYVLLVLALAGPQVWWQLRRAKAYGSVERAGLDGSLASLPRLEGISISDGGVDE